MAKYRHKSPTFWILNFIFLCALVIAAFGENRPMEYKQLDKFGCDFVDDPALRRGTGVFDPVLAKDIFWSIGAVGGPKSNYGMFDGIAGAIFTKNADTVEMSLVFDPASGRKEVSLGYISKKLYNKALDNLSLMCHKPNGTSNLGCDDDTCGENE